LLFPSSQYNFKFMVSPVSDIGH